MTLPYNVNIPFATNDPSVDQPDMLENTNTINTFVEQDHLGFNDQFNGNANSGGWHTDIHLINQGTGFVPTRITEVGQLFSKLVTMNGITSMALFFQSDTGVGASNSLTQITAPKNTVASSSGYTFLPGGIILNWGSVTGIAPVQHAFGSENFFFPYPNNVFQILVTPISISQSVTTQATISVCSSPATTLTAFGWNYVKGSPGTDYRAFSWIAIGN